MAAISANTLFHFTSTAEKLISILTHEFQPNYCVEKFNFNNNPSKIGLPMVCFCDIPLSQMKNHINTYGVYGLGMSKSWAQKNGLSPVLYLTDNSKMYHILRSMVAEKFANGEELKKNQLVLDMLIEYIKLFRFLKPYEGDLVRGSNILKNIRFYDEREWRYVPEISKEEFRPFIMEEEIENSILVAQANELLKKAKLSFEPSDINYVIVKEEKEIYPMIGALRQIKEKYGLETIDILISKIITSDQILNDF